MLVTVTPYDPQWPRTFETIRSHLTDALADVPVVAVEHVGSTSVPGLAAKPVLDIDIVVERSDLDDAIHALTAAGYSHEGDKGVPDRHFFRVSPAGEHSDVDELRDAYAAVKLDLAQRELDGIEDYIDGKNEILQRILAAAGITEDDRGQILTVNQKPA